MEGFAGWISKRPEQNTRNRLTCMATPFYHDHAQKILNGRDGGYVHTNTVCHYEIKNGTHLLLLGEIYQQGSSEPLNLESILSLFLSEGASFLSNMHGSFALCILDESTKNLYLATDKFATYALYYATDQESVYFGTQSHVLLKHPSLNKTLNPQALYNYFYFHFIPSPQTVCDSIHKVPAGHCVKLTLEGVQTKAYSHPKASCTTKRHTFKNDKQALFKHLENAMAPFHAQSPGAFLSGGLDSSTVVGMLHRINKSPIHTFTIGFHHDRYDESDFAELVSRTFKTKHHHLTLQARDLFDALPDIIQKLDQPFANASLIGAYFCSKLAKEHRITTLLAGDGGDELFGGNTRYVTQRWFNHYMQIPKALRKTFLEAWIKPASKPNTWAIMRKVEKFIHAAQMPVPLRLEIHNLFKHLALDDCLNKEWRAQIDPNEPQHRLLNDYEQAYGHSWLAKHLCMDMKWVLADNDIFKVRNACQMNDVSVHFPFLNDGLVKFALNLPDHYKVKGNQCRPFYKQAMKGFLPDAIIKKKKHGFGVPVGQWILNHPPLKAYVYDTLNEFKKRSIFDAHFIDHLKDTLLHEHPNYYGVMVWVLFILETWLQYHIPMQTIESERPSLTSAI